MTSIAVRILIVDDEPPIRKLLRVGLSTQNYAVIEAMNAKVAMELVKSEKPDLIVRIRVALRHRLQSQGEKPVFQVGELSVDLVKRIVRVAGEEVKLSPKEYDILRILVQHAGRVLTHRYLLEHVWDGLTDVQYLRVYVRQLRQKIERAPDQPRYILTETGVGYRLADAS